MKKSVLISCAMLIAMSGIAQNSPYLHHVWEYVPAPGQFVNTMPAYEEGDDADAMCRKVEQQVANNTKGLITLGGWGGYMVFSFDHPVVNMPEEKDFIIEGNAFYQSATEGAAGGGSCEPGIVLVSVDANGNGLPDDEWYELAGSEYTNPLTRHGYTVTYERPAEGHVPTPDPDQRYRTDTTYIHWTDNRGEDGYLEKNSFHTQAYYPEWIESDKITFEGARLPDNYQLVGKNYVLYPYEYGYADNHPDTCSLAQLDIEWAVNADGTPIHLNAIHFIKVYTALHQQCGTIGETSTEVKGARDLHPDAPMPESLTAHRTQPVVTKILHDGQLMIIRNNKIYNPLGTIINTNY